MNKTELIEKMASRTGMTKKCAQEALNAYIDVVTETLAKGEDVALIGFGTFSVAERPAHEGINPRTHEKIQIPASKTAKFKVGASLKEAIR
ncbi:MAG: HU family DNA-binding protein [Paludibacteraceae bacterium]|nr:HU family DNA-binding protein [Paludibacteraceae bacterium]